MPIASRMMLMIISAETNSIGRNGLIIRLLRLRDHISSRKDTEKPSWPRNKMSHISTARDEHAAGAGEKAAEFCAM